MKVSAQLSAMLAAARFRRRRAAAPSFLGEFDRTYADRLTYRAVTFRAMFEALEQTGQRSFNIIETGTTRKVWGDGIVYGPQVPADHPWYPQGAHGPWADGQSTILFDRFVNFHAGKVISIDLSADAVAAARSAVSGRTEVICADSVRLLWDLAAEGTFMPDLVYLDSFDCDWDNAHLSGLHHLKEFAALRPILKTGTILAIDDCHNADGRRGKGLYLEDMLIGLGLEPIVSAYQVVWRLP